MTFRLCEPLLEKIVGTVVCVIDGNETEFANGFELAAKPFGRKYAISQISFRDGRTVIKLQESNSVQNDLKAEWAQKQIRETGKEPSFF